MLCRLFQIVNWNEILNRNRKGIWQNLVKLGEKNIQSFLVGPTVQSQIIQCYIQHKKRTSYYTNCGHNYYWFYEKLRNLNHTHFAAYMTFSFLSHSFMFFGSIFYHCIYGCTFCVLLFNFVNYVYLLLCLCILIVMFMYSYDMIYLLTAIGLSPGGSSTN